MNKYFQDYPLNSKLPLCNQSAIRVHLKWSFNQKTKNTGLKIFVLFVVQASTTRKSSKKATKAVNLKRFIQGLVFKGILKGQESKSWDFFECPRRFRGPQKSEKFNFSKPTNKSVDHIQIFCYKLATN